MSRRLRRTFLVRPIARSPDHPMARSHPIAPTSSKCRECLGAMAHRLAQPMTALRGSIELGLMGKRSAADYRSVLEQSLQLADNLSQLIVSLRDLGESSAPGGAAQRVLLNATATEVLAEMEGLAQSRDLHLQLHARGKRRFAPTRNAFAKRSRAYSPGSSRTVPEKASSPWNFRRRRGNPHFPLASTIGLAVPPDQSP